MTPEREKELKVIYVKCKGSFLFFVRYMFREIRGKKYVVAEHHLRIAETLERVVRGEITRLIINIAPRYGKTELAVKMWIAWCLAFQPGGKFIHLSYSDDLALDNSRFIKDYIESETYQELFKVKLRKDSKSIKKWYTTEDGGVYATSAGGQVTGFGAGELDTDEEMEEFMGVPQAISVGQWVEDFYGALVIDDANKPEDAGSSKALTKVTDRFDSTLRDRTNSRRTPIVAIGQRIDPEDLCGHLIDLEPEVWYVLKMPCIKEDGTALYPRKHTLEELLHKKKITPLVFDNQYMQDPKPRQGLMYVDFKTYKELPKLRIVKAYCDTADTGTDYLCSIVYGVPKRRKDPHLYLIDVIYTKRAMEATEPMVAKQYESFKVRRANIESNSGGRGFARKVNTLTNSDVFISWFHQKDNKDSRIYSNSGSVNYTILMPEGWETRFPEFHHSITRYKKEGGNKHDDAEDTITGCYEKTKNYRVPV